jgi:glyoxylase-like metal-dependent hydrolase (beta-lactamase superfamily II)
MIRVGRYDVFSVVNGWLRLDGGAMFGQVPKVLWEPGQDVDDMNRILMATRTLVAIDRDGGRVFLVDTGVGSKWEGDEAERYAIEDAGGSIEGALGIQGLGVADVTDVVITHAHFDHCGGLTVMGEGGVEVRFPGSRHWVHERQWSHARQPFDKDRASYLERDLAVLDDAGVLEIVRGEEPEGPADGVSWLVANGHTPGMLLPVFEDARRPLLFAGDMMPTSAHVPPLWVMAYDLNPLVTIEEKMKVLEMCRLGMVLAFPHDRSVGGAGVDPGAKRPRAGTPLDLDP